MAKPNMTDDTTVLDNANMQPIVDAVWDAIGDGTNAPTTAAEVMANLFSGGATIHPTADAIALLVQGYGSTGTANVAQLSRSKGGKTIWAVSSNSSPVMEIQSDNDDHSPLLIVGNSASATGALLSVNRNGSANVFNVLASGGINMVDPDSSGLNTYINFSGGHQITFFNDGSSPGSPTIATNEPADSLSFKTSTTATAFDVTNFVMDNTGTTFKAKTTIDTGVRINIVDNQSTVGASGSASTLPSAPAGYANIQINGTEYVVPYYEAA